MIFSPSTTRLSIQTLKHRLLAWADSYPYVVFLDNCQSDIDQYGQYELLLGVASAPNLITSWEELSQQQGRWLMGGLPYELKNVFEPQLKSQNPESLCFPEVAFFEPETVVAIRRGSSEIEVFGKAENLDSYMFGPVAADFGMDSKSEAPVFVSNFTRESYLATIEKLRNHIREGDFYELNLSQLFTADYRLEKPAALLEKLTQISPVPFAAYMKLGEKHLLCASPERFLQLKGDRLLTQPMKGTAPRGRNETEDRLQIEGLKASLKERAENVMIVDLSRNDLYRSSEVNSVEVPRLFEIQTFPKVHQMVSTITGKKQKALNPWEVLSRTFPAGSMTGAPKVMSMQMIDRYESSRRDLYAGSVGYVSPEGDFDFNVVIRSLLYDEKAERLYHQVGGAITYDSDPLAEYQETLIKARAIRNLFGLEEHLSK